MSYNLRNNRRHKFIKTHFKIANWLGYNQAFHHEVLLRFGYQLALLNHGMPTKTRGHCSNDGNLNKEVDPLAKPKI